MDPGAAQNWGAELFPYIKSIDMYVCQSAPNDSGGFGPSTLGGAGKTSYTFNGCISSKAMTSVAKPAEIIIFQGRATTVREAIVTPRMSAFSDGTTKANDADDSWIGFTHDYGDNYTYSDGHAKFKKRNAVLFKELGFWEWVNVNGQWINPDTNPTMSSDPNRGINNWGTWGNCDASLVQ
jgi:hypothetical protein